MLILIASGIAALVVLLVIVAAVRRRISNDNGLGSMSEQWLAENRASHTS